MTIFLEGLEERSFDFGLINLIMGLGNNKNQDALALCPICRLSLSALRGRQDCENLYGKRVRYQAGGSGV